MIHEHVINQNIFTYCLNDCLNYEDPVGSDAIWLQDKTSVGGLGHTGLLLQDKKGKWHHFYWGANRNGKTSKIGDGEVVLPYNGKITFDAINSFYKSKNNGKKYEVMLLFKGDFSKSVAHANKIKGYLYSFIFNNCMQVCTDVLRRGKFKYDNLLWQSLLLSIRFVEIPNVAYQTVLGFCVASYLSNAAFDFTRTQLKKVKFIKGVSIL